MEPKVKTLARYERHGKRYGIPRHERVFRSMKAALSLAILLLIAHGAFSQGYPPTPQSDSTILKRLMVKEVKDLRALTAEKDITAMDDLWLESTEKAAIDRFLQKAYVDSAAPAPIIIEIHALSIHQSQTSVDAMTARVHVRLAFIINEAGSRKLLFNISHNKDQEFALSQTEAIQQTTEARITAAFEYCLAQFNARYAGEATTNHNASLAPEEPVLPLDGMGKWFDIVVFKKLSTRYNSGWNISYIGFVDNDKDLILPFTISYGQYNLKRGILESKGYESVDTYSLGFGFEGYIKLAPGLYGSIGLGMPIGLQTLTDKAGDSDNDFLIGLGAKQGIRYIPWQEFGLVIGIGLSQQIQNSKVYTTDIGYQLEFGINF